MKLNIWPFPFSVGIVTAIASVICGLLIALAPDATMAAVSYLFHIDLTGLDRIIIWKSFFAGLAVFVFGQFLDMMGEVFLCSHFAP